MSDAQGLIIVHTGNGKGKTTAALGMAFRAWGQGMRILIIQFIKGGWKYGELAAAQQLGPRFIIRQMGEGFVKGATQDKATEHRQAAAEALKAAEEAMSSGQWDMIILDEVNYALHYGLITLEEVLALLNKKPAALHLILTGRNAAADVIERADLVTEMKEIKHPYQKGIKAQKGIEF
ncbi:cob(I)yrinic acid a,c-diamide adenosyltransferase [Acetonema longum]|uniref:ATP:corrinoid adenosyltransferase n=1 Tax=Acetonema longum DSM 6540 TaxID=1009370 RepID=F7NMD1_9FIRM|nr:cob(I)yrinic acid a,c-diamide adenosyltransferase [Acetonema longum]EGO62807.1 ATP:corrinoid adenosyltransferase [Acetonema longum DSM 6540]